MDSKLSKTKNFIGEMLIGLVFLFATVGLILSSVDRFVSSKEYKKSTDVRTITARVVDYDIKSSGDEYDDDYKYVTKLSYEVDGKKYTGKRTYYREVSIGDEKEIEVYLTSRGKYKMKGDDDPKECYKEAKTLIAGEEPEEFEVDVPAFTIDSSNIDEYLDADWQ